MNRVLITSAPVFIQAPVMPLENSRDTILQFKNCRILQNHEIIREDLWVRNGRILNPEKLFFEEKSDADIQIDCGGHIIAPGYIDVQINGKFVYIY